MQYFIFLCGGSGRCYQMLRLCLINGAYVRLPVSCKDGGCAGAVGLLTIACELAFHLREGLRNTHSGGWFGRASSGFRRLCRLEKLALKT